MGLLCFGKRERGYPTKPDTNKIPFTTDLIANPLLNLPAVYHDTDTHRYYRLDDLPTFVRKDLKVDRIDDIRKWLWVCGAKGVQRPLHYQKGIRSRQIVVVEQSDLHLCWDVESGRLFLKPLPGYLLNRKFWTDHICTDETRFRNALGFLRTYVHLIPHEIDFENAMEERLLPKNYRAACNGDDPSEEELRTEGEALTWPQWRQFVKEFVGLYEDGIPNELRGTRWGRSELRIGRLNLVYRIYKGHIFRGYTFGYTSYGSFLSRNSSWLIAVFAYVAIAHGAMQVGLATPQLEHNEAFARACYGFAVFSIVAPVGVLTILITWMTLMFIDNAIFAKIGGKKKRKNDLEARAAAKKAWNSNAATAPDPGMHPYIPKPPPHQNGMHPYISSSPPHQNEPRQRTT